MRIRGAFASLVLLAAAFLTAQQAPVSPWQAVERSLGRAGEERDGVHRVAFPRTDLRVRAGGVNIRAALALTSWAAFQKSGNATMVMGDLVLLAGEVSPVVSKLSEGGIEITALHNHLLGEQPRVMYAHFHGHGDAAQLAATLRAALVVTGTPLTTPRPRPPGPFLADDPKATAQAAELDKLRRILGYEGRIAQTGVFGFTIPRAETITGAGGTLGPRMGLGTAINFQTEGSGAATTGDFVLVASEVQPVIRALRAHGIEVTALHNHMLDEQPRLFFLHFWGRGDAEQLARGLRAALDVTNHGKGSGK
jgi:hypothetical protein